MPIDAEMSKEESSTSIGLLILSRTLRATIKALCRLASSPRIITNSSPPVRAKVSTARKPGRDPADHLLQAEIAGGMAKGVIDLLEAIQVQTEDRGLLAVAGCLGQTLLHAIFQQ